MDSYSGSNVLYFWKKKLFVDIARQVIVENVKFKTYSYGLQSCKKGNDSRHAQKLRFPLKVSENVSDKYSVLESPCYKIIGL